MITDPSRMATKEELESLKIQPATLIECPVYKDDLEKVATKKKKDFENDLSVQMYRLQEFRRVSLADIERATSIPISTLYEWSSRKVTVQMLDDNIKKLARFFDCSIDFLVFGTPISDRDIQLDDMMPDTDKRWEG
jgi:hypothetical protein